MPLTEDRAEAKKEQASASASFSIDSRGSERPPQQRRASWARAQPTLHAADTAADTRPIRATRASPRKPCARSAGRRIQPAARAAHHSLALCRCEPGASQRTELRSNSWSADVRTQPLSVFGRRTDPRSAETSWNASARSRKPVARSVRRRRRTPRSRQKPRFDLGEPWLSDPVNFRIVGENAAQQANPSRLLIRSHSVDVRRLLQPVHTHEAALFKLGDFPPVARAGGRDHVPAGRRDRLVVIEPIRRDRSRRIGLRRPAIALRNTHTRPTCQVEITVCPANATGARRRPHLASTPARTIGTPTLGSPYRGCRRCRPFSASGAWSVRISTSLQQSHPVASCKSNAVALPIRATWQWPPGPNSARNSLALTRRRCARTTGTICKD